MLVVSVGEQILCEDLDILTKNTHEKTTYTQENTVLGILAHNDGGISRPRQ